MHKNRLLFVPLVITCLLAVVACQKNGEGGGPLVPGKQPVSGASKGTIGVSVLTINNPFFKEMGDAMTAEAEKNGYKVQLLSGDNDSAKQSDQVKDFIVKKYCAIILCPCNSRTIGTSIIEANKAGIPVFTADIACLDKTAKVVTHIATDNYEGGKLAGQAMVDLLGGKGNIGILDYPEVESVMLRTKGFREVVDKVPGIKIVSVLPGGGDRDKSYASAQDMLQKNPDINAIFAINDPSAFGAVAAIEKANKSGIVKVIGFDGQPEAKLAIRDGKIEADAIQFPDKIGKMAIQSIVGYLNGEKQPEQQLIPTAIYRKADAINDKSLK